MDRKKFNNFFYIQFFFFLFFVSVLPGSALIEICPGKVCSPPCYGIEGSDCSCAPRGCDGLPDGSLSIDVLSSKPFCKHGKVLCNQGVPDCRNKDLRPVCGGWLFGFRAGLSGPGCTKRYARTYSYFDKTNVYCRTQALSPGAASCTQSELCDKNSKRKKPCREDRFLCQCVCPFEIQNQKYTPSCNANDKPKCPKNLVPKCSLSSNAVGCEGGKLYCKSVVTGAIDLKDKIFCK